MPASSSPPRRLFPLRFSLRVLFLAFTAFAIGFPVWYRWPYEDPQDESVLAGSGTADPFAAPGAVVRRPAVARTLVSTWQRQWGGGRLKHGSERLYKNGTVLSETTFRNGIRHGVHKAGSLSGQYVEGKKEGVWEVRDPKGNVVRSATWHSDRLDGLFEFVQDVGTERERRRKWVFSTGRLVSIDGEPFEDRLGQLVSEDKIELPELARELAFETSVEFLETPLKDAADFLATKHDVPIVVDPRHANPQQPLTGTLYGIPLSSALTILMSEHGHGCDYRYGMIWITSAEDAKVWHDPTGVADIKPPKDSQLARSWNEPVAIGAINQPLADVLTKLVQPLAISLDASAIESTDETTDEHLVTATLNGLPFRHVLGAVLYKSGCRVKLNGETLVILPPE